MNLLPDQTLIAQWIIFALVYLVLTRLVFRPILQTLSLRAARTSGLAEAAKTMTERADLQVQKYEMQIREAKAAALAEKDRILHQAIKEKESILQEAKRAWDESIQGVRAELASELTGAGFAIKGEVAGLARVITEKVLA